MRYANRLKAATSLSKPGSASTTGSSWVTSANIRLIGLPFSSDADLLVARHADHAGRGDAASGDGLGVRAVLHAERLVGLGRAGERVVAAVRPVVEHRLERLADASASRSSRRGRARPCGRRRCSGRRTCRRCRSGSRCRTRCRSSPCRRRSPTRRRAAAPAGTCRRSSRGGRSAKRRERRTRRA